MSYGFKRKVSLPFEQALAKVKQELKKAGFETVTEINMRATLKDTLNIDYDSYVVLGVCSSEAAHKILEAEKEAGIYLPFNIAVYQEFEHVWISAARPSLNIGKGLNPYLEDLMGEIEITIQRAIQSVT